MGMGEGWAGVSSMGHFTVHSRQAWQPDAPALTYLRWGHMSDMLA